MTEPRKPRQADSGFDPAALDRLLGERRTMADMDELFRQMKRALMERAFAGELTHHLGYAPGAAKPKEQPNHRNGSTPKTVLTEDGAIPVAIPRDRAGTFDFAPFGISRSSGFSALRDSASFGIRRRSEFSALRAVSQHRR